MFVAQWIKFMSTKFSESVSTDEVRRFLASYELPSSVLDELAMSVKTKAQLEQVVAKAAQSLWQQHTLSLADELHAWSTRTTMPSELIVAAQWVVGKERLHPCFAPCKWLDAQTPKNFDRVWYDMSSDYSVEDLSVSPTKNGFHLILKCKSRFIDFETTRFKDELHFWLAFVDSVLIRNMTDLPFNGAKIRCMGPLGAWSVLAKFLESQCSK